MKTDWWIDWQKDTRQPDRKIDRQTGVKTDQLTERQSDRDTEIQTERQKDREADRKAGRQTARLKTSWFTVLHKKWRTYDENWAGNLALNLTPKSGVVDAKSDAEKSAVFWQLEKLVSFLLAGKCVIVYVIVYVIYCIAHYIVFYYSNLKRTRLFRHDTFFHLY